MNGKERDVLVKVETNQKWMMESMKELKTFMETLDKRCDMFDVVREQLTNHLTWHKGREAFKIGIASAVSSAITGVIISAIAGLI